MKVKEMKSVLESNKFDNVECNFRLKSKGPKVPEWFNKFHEEEFVPLRDAFIKSQTEAPEWFKQFAIMVEKRFDQLESRIDNLVSKNNLKE